MVKRWGKARIAGIWILLFMVFAVIVSEVPRSSKIDPETGTSAMTAPALLVCIGAPSVLTYLMVRKNRQGKSLYSIFRKTQIPSSEDDLKLHSNISDDESTEEAEKIWIPFSAKKRKELVRSLQSSAQIYENSAYESTSIQNFIIYYDAAIKDARKLSELEKKIKVAGPSPAFLHRRLIEEFQWHLCDAIDCAKKQTIAEIKGKYRNSVEYQKKCENNFVSDVNRYRVRFSPDTSEFADKAVEEVQRASGVIIAPEKQNSYASAIVHDMMDIDKMEGHDFEYWCADLLKKNGYVNVQVTPGSGDQGVDVLAEKDGIKYAIQCKCYSKDLGNTPVQEVESGRVYYGCHVGAVMTNRYFTQGAKELAQKTGTLLWDRDFIKNLSLSDAHDIVL